MTPPSVDLTHFLKLRLVVARHGEMDAARWWNSRGMLGRHGAMVLTRGFPRTHNCMTISSRGYSASNFGLLFV
jgi:hypothetical protein